MRPSSTSGTELLLFGLDAAGNADTATLQPTLEAARENVAAARDNLRAQ